MYAFYRPITGRSVGGCPVQLNPQEINDLPHDVILKFPAHIADLEDWAAEQQINVPDQGLGDGQGRFVSDRHTDQVFSEVVYCL